MANEPAKSSILNQIVVAAVIALLVGGTSPWWWKEIFGGKQDTTNVTPQVSPQTVGRAPATDIRKYWMDRRADRVIVVTRLQKNEFRIEEPTSPWPWEGTATIDGGQLSGHAKFRNSLATMRVEGVVRGDRSIVTRYVFITGSDGKSSAGRVDNHIWYPAG